MFKWIARLFQPWDSDAFWRDVRAVDKDAAETIRVWESFVKVAETYFTGDMRQQLAQRLSLDSQFCCPFLPPEWEAERRSLLARMDRIREKREELDRRVGLA